MEQRGFSAPIVIGHSNGGMLGVAHTAAHPETPALVLLSAHRGGAGAQTVPAQKGLAGDDYEATMAKAKALVAAGRGKELLNVPNWWYVVSAESYVDRFTTMPDTFELAPRIKCPVLYVRGSQEPKTPYPAEGYQERAGGPCDVEIVEGGDHFYNGIEDTVCRVVADWLNRRLPA
jgi:pimeloyl-ACP methyl ester carboxylesterase